MPRVGAFPVMLGAFLLSSLRIAATPALRYPPSRIAVIGAGIGGTSTAYFLRQKFGKDVPIDIFEKGEVGGRLRTIEMEGNHYEAGGAIIHPLNLHMKTFVKELGLNPLKPTDGLLGIFSGDQFVFQQSDWFLINIIKMLWQYGFNFLKMYMWIDGILDRFMRIYRYQTHDYSFSTTEAMLHAMGGDDFLEKLNMTIDEAMQKAGFSQRFIEQIVVPAMRVNYLQGLEINAFVGAVSLAGTDSGLWAVEGGNKLVCSGLLYASKAQLIKGTVTSVQEKIRPTKSGGKVKLYELNYESDSGPGMGLYDIVVIATPLNKEIGNIEFVGFNPPIETYAMPYQTCVSTFVHGRINASYFGYPKASQFHLTDILTTFSPKLFVNSLGAVSPVKPVSSSDQSKASDLRVWKVFSPEVLTEGQLRQLFESYHAVSVTKWLAYPKYSPPEKLPPIILHRGIYSVNSIERAASAMEMSAISAMNVALLSHHRWYEKNDRIDQENLVERIKSEL